MGYRAVGQAPQKADPLRHKLRVRRDVRVAAGCGRASPRDEVCEVCGRVLFDADGNAMQPLEKDFI